MSSSVIIRQHSILVVKAALLLLVSLLLSQCVPVAEGQVQTASAPLGNPYALPVDSSLALAENATGSSRTQYRLQAAGRAIQDGNWKQGQTILDSLENPDAAQSAEASLLRANIAHIRENPQEVLKQLAMVQHVNSLPVWYQVRYHSLLAGVYEAQGNLAEAVSQRMVLDTTLPDGDARTANRRKLWKALGNLSSADLDTMTLEAQEGSLEQGWLKLAAIPRKYGKQPREMLNRLSAWELEFPTHPGGRILAHQLPGMEGKLVETPRQVALLLPLSGSLAGPGSAVRDGFMAASSENPGTIVRVYDTAGADVASLYQKAVEEGAGYVVGPLSRQEVAAVARLEHPVPTLLLNAPEARLDENAWQLSLSPASEARQVARYARERGLSRALVIAPASPWGEEISGAFVQAWRKSGGTVTDTFSYGAKDDLSKGIREVLHYSERPDKDAKPVQGRVRKIISRREDFDMIFLLAYPSNARQLMPLLKYYYAGNVPVFATSSVYAGSVDPKKDRDLDGIVFCDMPWVFTNNLGNRNWPEQFNSYNRLYALGMDSFALSSGINQLMLFPSMGITRRSGVLYLNPDRQIGRALVFGQFRQGTPQMKVAV